MCVRNQTRPPMGNSVPFREIYHQCFDIPDLSKLQPLHKKSNIAINNIFYHYLTLSFLSLLNCKLERSKYKREFELYRIYTVYRPFSKTKLCKIKSIDFVFQNTFFLKRGNKNFIKTLKNRQKA